MKEQEFKQVIEELRKLPKENEWVEFKSGNATKNERLGQYISALSNAACLANQAYGFLIFGIDDNSHEVVGTSYSFKNRKEGNEELELWIRRLLYPSIRFEHFCGMYEEKYMEVFRIPAAKGEPTNFKNQAYIRFNSSVADLKKFPHFIRTIYNSEDDWSAKINENATIDDLDPEAILKAKEKFKEKNSGSSLHSSIDGWDSLTFLDKAKVTINSKITNTALILLGKTESAHLLSPAVAQITWKLDTEEKAYEHFEMPLFLAVNKILAKIRNVKYKFFPDNQLLSTEVNKYETKVILEALNNCIAHQDYSRHSRIILTEQINKLIFTNAGGFFEGSAEDYTTGEKTPDKYRNRWLAQAMVNLNMIDTMGYGIHRMYVEQRNRYFPLPDYTNSTSDKVVLEIYGHSIDENYSKLLIEKKDDLSLIEVILLDKVQKQKPINNEAAKLLKRKKLIEGRKPNFYISAKVAEITNQKAAYTKNKGLDKKVFKSFILEHIKIHGYATRQEIDSLILDKLPDYLTEKQCKTKVHNILSEMSGDSIKNVGSRTDSKWVLI